MDIPKPNTTEIVIHHGKEEKLAVRRVEPERGVVWRIWVEPFRDVFCADDVAYWRDTAGILHPTIISNLRHEGNRVEFSLLASKDT
ncbi:MAG: hypothetical protein JWL90_281 [Chthoniobacteraceae bacterium]|nr:hypothetical protein [Chthoniobacteraceae bacterium]